MISDRAYVDRQTWGRRRQGTGREYIPGSVCLVLRAGVAIEKFTGAGNTTCLQTAKDNVSIPY